LVPQRRSPQIQAVRVRSGRLNAKVATTIVAGFFGLGFFLLTYPDEKLIAGPDCDTRDGEIGHAMSVKGV
jgi:hypothetical protein